MGYGNVETEMPTLKTIKIVGLKHIWFLYLIIQHYVIQMFRAITN